MPSHEIIFIIINHYQHIYSCWLFMKCKAKISFFVRIRIFFGKNAIAETLLNNERELVWAHSF